MKQLEIENGDFPPKSVELVTLTSTPCYQPKRIKSVEKTSDSVKITVTERSSSHFPPKKNLARQLVFTEFGLSPIISTSSPLPVEKPGSEMHLSPRSPFSSMYCDCFASGEYCNGCTCADCCNNVENEDQRKAATEIILERNPRAFKPKISNSPCSPQDIEGDKIDSPQVGRHERGCHCKKSECLKRYCECFQANVFCSQNCKCVDCKNFEACKELITASCKEDSTSIICKNSEGCYGRIASSQMDNASRKLYKSFKGSEGLMAITGGDCIDTKIYIQRVITTTSDATGLSGQRLSQESRKRKLQELPSNEKISPSQSFSDLQKVISQRSSCPSSTLSVDPTCHIINSAMVGSLRDPYRLTVANVYHLLDTSKVCSGLAVLAEAAALAQAANLFAEVKDGEENKNGDILGAKEDDYQERPAQVQKKAADDLNLGFAAKDVQEGRASLPGMVGLICNEKNKLLMEPTSGDQILNRNLKNAYAEQERSVLSSFLDFLEKLIISKNMKMMLFYSPFIIFFMFTGQISASMICKNSEERDGRIANTQMDNAEDRN
ncbi:hypothetical protein Goshw_006536 [Gossypium schwendimanii]|uniref:CRC domain-containing protein n=1 Tax=Gossypium schwendimanii TaxID=34291 RepID=A0A7J9MGV2_GOSSC|nr:hypothetical protein [Gossypium schwendimanii]